MQPSRSHDAANWIVDRENCIISMSYFYLCSAIKPIAMHQKQHYINYRKARGLKIVLRSAAGRMKCDASRDGRRGQVRIPRRTAPKAQESKDECHGRNHYCCPESKDDQTGDD